MRELLEMWQRMKGLIEEAQTVHSAIAQRTEPSVVDVVLPIAYKHFVNGNIADAPESTAFVSIAGHYLGQRYPELREYVLTGAQRDRLTDLRTQIDQILRGEDAS